ncbi:MAG: hypothetical protein OEZ16_02335 [Chromatiales bacterium]|nr:hypothetical protein [Chromatiales bacterium]
MVNLQALNILINDTPGAIEAYATEIGMDPTVARGLAILLIANDGNLASLSVNQREHYEKVVLPLLMGDV